MLPVTRPSPTVFVLKRTTIVYVGRLYVFEQSFAPVSRSNSSSFPQSATWIPEVMKKIGAETTYQECPEPPYDLFMPSGVNDSMSVLMDGCLIARTLVDC